MNLCLDIGNTRIKVGVFQDDNMVYHDVIDQNIDDEIDLIFKHQAITKIISSSTRNYITSFEEMILQNHHLLRLDHQTPVPFDNRYKTKSTLGKDRIAVIAAGASFYKGEPSLIVDLGTCITYDFVDGDAIYHGGNIAPGLHMRLQSMHDYTAGLPKAEIHKNNHYLGQSTEEALQNGAIYGIKFEIESLIKQLSDEYGDINVILTGGDANFFVDLINSEIFVHPYFVLEGLNEIIKYNEA